MRRTTCTLILAATVAVAALSAVRAHDGEMDTELVDALNARYGVHPGYRANHAKGVVTSGSFIATPQAAMLSTSPLFLGAELPVTVRFSDSSGLPDLHDAAPLANPHGMAIKFHLPDGSESDIVANTLKFFFVATPAEFRDLQLAAASSPPGAPSSAELNAFLAKHPSVKRATATLGIPASFADEQYYGIDAFLLTDAAGQRRPFRYIIAAESVMHLSPAEAARRSPNYLFEELPARLGSGPVTFQIKAQLAAPGDSTKDPTKAWPDDREVVTLGVLTIDKLVSDSDAAQKRLLFLPGRLTEGIEPSDDPLISARDGAYAESFERRTGNETP